MALEDEIKKEIKRLEEEISFIDKEISRHQARLDELLEKRKRTFHDLEILKSAFEPKAKKDKQTSLFYLR